MLDDAIDVNRVARTLGHPGFPGLDGPNLPPSDPAYTRQRVYCGAREMYIGIDACEKCRAGKCRNYMNMIGELTPE